MVTYYVRVCPRRKWKTLPDRRTRMVSYPCSLWGTPRMWVAAGHSYLVARSKESR